MLAQPRTKQSQHWSASQHPTTMTDNWRTPSQIAQGLRLAVIAIVISAVLTLTGQNVPQTSTTDISNQIAKVQIDPSCSPFASLTDCFIQVK